MGTMGRNVGDAERLEKGLAMLLDARRLYELGQFIECGEVLEKVLRIAQHDMGDKFEFEDLMAAYESARADALDEQKERV